MPCPCPICQKQGACCNGGNCTLETCQDCEDAGGLWQGFGTECDGSDCPCATPADHNLCEKCAGGSAANSCPDDQECCGGRCCGNGDFCCSYGCCYCKYASLWQIADTDGNVYATGPAGSGGLYGVPANFVPEMYWTTGAIDFELQVYGCENDPESFSVLSTWTMTITLCGTVADRYGWSGLPSPLSYPLLGVAVPAPSNCADKLRRCLNDCPSGGCEECPDIGVATNGTGLTGGVGYRFVGTIDGEWTNLNNWEDASGARAGSLPGTSDSVRIAADVTSKPTNYDPWVASLTIESGKSFAISARTATLLCFGTIARPSSPVCAGQYGDVTYDTSATFSNGTLQGRIQAWNNDAAVFNASSQVTGLGVVSGPATFGGNSLNAGTVTQNATFNSAAENGLGGVVQGSATFNGSSRNLGSVTGTATFNDSSCNSGTAGTLVPASPPAC